MRRRPAVAGLGVALVCLGGLAAAWLATSLDNSSPVVVAAHAVYRGQVIGPADLAVANVSGLAASSVLAGDQLAATVGQTAVTDLPAGMPVSPDSVTSNPLPGPGQSVVGIKLAAGQLPAVPLNAGDRVRVVGTPRAQDDPTPSAASSVTAEVASTSADDVSGQTVVNLVVPSTAAPGVAAMAATARVALILDNAAAGN